MAGSLFSVSSDASYANNVGDRKSTEGYLFSLFGGAIDWRAAKQKTVTTSTTEAELLSLSHCAKQLYMWRRFFQHMQLEIEEEQTVKCDNLQTIRLIVKESPKLVTKLKHVDIHNHWLKQEYELGNFKPEWVPTAEMPADGFTKALTRQKHEEFLRQLQLVDIAELLNKL